MPSIKKRPNSPNWVLCYKLADGTRVQRSSGTTDYYKATAMAYAAEGLARDYNRERALQMVDDIAHAAGHQLVNPVPVTAYFQNWRQARQGDWSDSSRKSFLAIEKRFLEHIGDMGLGMVSAMHVADYRDKMMLLGRSRRTIKGHIKYLRRIFSTAVESGVIDMNPAETVTTLPPKPSIKRPFSMDQFRALLNKTDGEWHLLILVAGLTGQRLNDVLALTHKQIDHGNGTIGFPRKKNRDWHYVPLHPTIAHALPEGFDKLFPELDALPKHGSRSVSTKFRLEILPLIGIVQEYGCDLNGNRQVTEFSFHSLRHMLSTELNRIGASQETRMAIVGHDDKKVSAGYTHADFETAKEMLGRVSV